MTNYPPGPYVRLEDVVNILNRRLNFTKRISNDLRLLPQYELFSNNEAEQLLTKVCEIIKDIKGDEEIKGQQIAFLDDVPGLIDWWAKNKPKTEREQKLETVVRSISLNGEFTKDLLPVAERVLQALGL
jgi:hypothetical protein